VRLGETNHGVVVRHEPVDGLRRAASWLVRERGFAGPAAISLALGGGLALSILGLLRLDSLGPLRLSATIAPHYLRDPGWAAKWSGLTLPPERVQAVHFESLLDVLAVVAILGFAIASFTMGSWVSSILPSSHSASSSSPSSPMIRRPAIRIGSGA